MIRNVPEPEPTCRTCRKWLKAGRLRRYYCSAECAAEAQKVWKLRWRTENREQWEAYQRAWRDERMKDPAYAEHQRQLRRDWTERNKDYLARFAQRRKLAEQARVRRARKKARLEAEACEFRQAEMLNWDSPGKEGESAADYLKRIGHIK